LLTPGKALIKHPLIFLANTGEINCLTIVDRLTNKTEQSFNMTFCGFMVNDIEDKA